MDSKTRTQKAAFVASQHERGGVDGSEVVARRGVIPALAQEINSSMVQPLISSAVTTVFDFIIINLKGLGQSQAVKGSGGEPPVSTRYQTLGRQ